MLSLVVHQGTTRIDCGIEGLRELMAIAARKLKDGSTVYDVRVLMGYRADGKQDRRCVTVRTKRAAQIEESKMIAQRDALRGRSGKMTLAQYVNNRYWPVARGRLAATSLDTYDQEIRLRILPTLGNLDMRDIDRVAIQRMIDTIPTQSVAKKALGTLKTILNEAKGDGLIISNPATAKYAMPTKGQKRDNGLVLTDFDQIRAFLAIVAQNGSQTVQRISFTGLLQGLRPEERYALDWEDFDMDGRTINVNSAYVKASPKHGGTQMKETKTELSTRTIPMHPDFYAWLSTLTPSSGSFINGVDGNRISPSGAQKQWRTFLSKNTELEKLTIENMRHSFATSYLAAGGRIEVLSKILGHSNIQTTINRYYRPDIETLRLDIFG